MWRDLNNKERFSQESVKGSFEDGRNLLSFSARPPQSPDDQSFNRWWDLTFGDEEREQQMVEKGGGYSVHLDKVGIDRLVIGEIYRPLEFLGTHPRMTEIERTVFIGEA